MAPPRARARYLLPAVRGQPGRRAAPRAPHLASALTMAQGTASSDETIKAGATHEHISTCTARAPNAPPTTPASPTVTEATTFSPVRKVSDSTSLDTLSSKHDALAGARGAAIAAVENARKRTLITDGRDAGKRLEKVGTAGMTDDVEGKSCFDEPAVAMDAVIQQTDGSEMCSINRGSRRKELLTSMKDIFAPVAGDSGKISGTYLDVVFAANNSDSVAKSTDKKDGLPETEKSNGDKTSATGKEIGHPGRSNVDNSKGESELNDILNTSTDKFKADSNEITRIFDTDGLTGLNDGPLGQTSASNGNTKHASAGSAPTLPSSPSPRSVDGWEIEFCDDAGATTGHMQPGSIPFTAVDLVAHALGDIPSSTNIIHGSPFDLAPTEMSADLALVRTTTEENTGGSPVSSEHADRLLPDDPSWAALHAPPQNWMQLAEAHERETANTGGGEAEAGGEASDCVAAVASSATKPSTAVPPRGSKRPARNGTQTKGGRRKRARKETKGAAAEADGDKDEVEEKYESASKKNGATEGPNNANGSSASTGSGASSPGSVESAAPISEEEQKRIRRVKNRASVEKCRNKQRMRLESLTREREALTVENTMLRSAAEQVRLSMSSILSQVAALSGVNCHMVLP